MSNAVTRRMIAAYFQDATPVMFLSGFFQTPSINFHNSEEVEIDIQRSDEDVATVITDLSTGANVNSFDGYTNKSFKPPVYDESAPINAFDLIKRMPGEDPFRDPSFLANASVQAFRTFRLLENKVRRAVEVQASQVFQTGQLVLKNSAGVDAYLLDFKPKATHLPTVTTNWADAGSDKINDLNNLAKVIRTDGLTRPDTLIFGEQSFEHFIKDEEVQKLLDNRRIIVGEVMPEVRGEGATFQGYIWINNYRYAMWTYDGQYTDRSTGSPVATPYIDPNKVIMLDSGARFDLTFGSIPLIGRTQQVISGMPERMTSTENGFGMTTNSWITEDGKSLKVSAGTRPLTIPTAIDRYGCLTTQQ